MPKRATESEITTTLAQCGLAIDGWWLGDRGDSWEFAAGIGADQDVLELACSVLAQRGASAIVAPVTNPEYAHRGALLLHITGIPRTGREPAFAEREAKI